MTLSPNSKPFPCVACIRLHSHHLPTRKIIPTDRTAAVGRRKSTRLSIKSTKNSSDLFSHPAPPKPLVKNTLQNDHPPSGYPSKEISPALSNPSLNDDQMIDILVEEKPLGAKASTAQELDNRGTQPPPAQENATYTSTLPPTKDHPAPECGRST